MAASRDLDPRFVVYHCTCGARIELPEASAGRKARCRKCQRIFVVPLTASLSFEPPPVIIEIEPDASPIAPGFSLVGTAFWQDLGRNFVFFAFKWNALTWFWVAVMHFLFAGILILPFVGRGMILMFMLEGVIGGWLCAFYLATVLEAATGEHGLPDVRVSELSDLLDTLVDFVGAAALAMLPWIILRLLQAFSTWPIPDAAPVAAGMIGAFLWPGIVLTTAIGGGWAGLAPQIVLRVPLANPPAYLALGLLVGFAITLASPLDPFLIRRSITPINIANPWAMAACQAILTAYVGIFSMRAIGLYYRHFKHFLPFEAE